MLFAFARWRSVKSSAARFRRERTAVRRLLESCDTNSGACRVLIRRVPGMEDSSRFWSIWMTLDHLRIIHVSLARVIGTLARGAVPEGKASTAAVKPSLEAAQEVIVSYEESCDALLAAVAAAPDLRPGRATFILGSVRWTRQGGSRSPGSTWEFTASRSSASSRAARPPEYP